MKKDLNILKGKLFEEIKKLEIRKKPLEACNLAIQLIDELLEAIENNTITKIEDISLKLKIIFGQEAEKFNELKEEKIDELKTKLEDRKKELSELLGQIEKLIENEKIIQYRRILTKLKYKKLITEVEMKIIHDFLQEQEEDKELIEKIMIEIEELNN